MTTADWVRCAAFAAWTSAALRGEVGVEQALDTLHSNGIDPVIVAAEDGAAGELRFALAVGRWRAAGVQAWRYVPTAPGDAAGLPGPPSFRGAAIDAGVALIALGDVALGLLPEESGEGRGVLLTLVEHTTEGGGHSPVDTVPELDRQLLEALTEASDTLTALEVAEWNEDLPLLLSGWGQGAALPPGAHPRAQQLALRSQKVLELLALAGADSGNSRTAGEMALRSTTLQHLARVARAAHAAAWNTGPADAGRRR